MFSWRGNYAEVAFTPSLEGTTEESLELINDALEKLFNGYKGGYFEYDLTTDVHFEFDVFSYTDCSPEEFLSRYLNTDL